MAPSSAAPAAVMYQMITGFYVSRSIFAAADLGLADLLHDKPRSCTDLARATGTDAPSLFRLLRLLVSAGVFAEHDDGSFALSPVGEYLRSDTPDSMRAVAQLLAGPAAQLAWSGVTDGLRTGRPTLGEPFYDYLAARPDQAAVFNRAMISLAGHLAPAIVGGYDFTPVRTVVDVGGGHGELLRQLLAANPGMRGVLFDRPGVAADGLSRIAAAGLGDRCEAVEGDFFDEVPEGGDAYILRGVVHNWDDERARVILTNCATAMTPDSRLLLVETVVPDTVDQSPAASAATGVDVNMMVMLGGRERTWQEFGDLFDAAGLTLTKITPIGISPSGIARPHHVIEGVRR